MRVYPHWIIRFGWMVIAIPPAVAFGVMAILNPFALDQWAPVVLSAVFIALGLRAVIGGVEVSGGDYIVRNLLTTKRIPRERVTGFEPRGNFWSIAWRTSERDQQATHLTWFPGVGRPFAVHWHNEKSIAVLRAWQSEAHSTT